MFLHCLIHCSRSAVVWQGCGFTDTILLCSSLDMDDMAKVIHKIMRDIGIIAPLIMWNIWCPRNKLVFDNTQPDMPSTVGTIFSQLHHAN